MGQQDFQLGGTYAGIDSGSLPGPRLRNPPPRIKGILPGSGTGAGIGLESIGSGPRSRWAGHMSLVNACELTSEKLEVEKFCDALKRAGFDSAKVDAAASSFTSADSTLEAFFCDLSRSLDVIVELRVKNEDGADGELLEFNNGMKVSYPEGSRMPIRDGKPVVQLSLSYRGGSWDWDVPPRRVVVDLVAGGEIPPIGKDQAMMAEVVSDANGSAQFADLASGTPTKLEHKRDDSLVSHKIEVIRTPEEELTILREVDSPFCPGERPIKEEPLCADGQPLSHDAAAKLVTQNVGRGGEIHKTCYVMSGLYALLTSSNGAKVLQENVKFNHPGPGRATVTFPNFKLQVELRMADPLGEDGSQVYSRSDPRVNLLVRAFDLARQASGARPVHYIGEAGLVFSAFGMKPKTIVELAGLPKIALRLTASNPVAGSKARTAFIAADQDCIAGRNEAVDELCRLAASWRKAGWPVTFLLKDHVLALRSCDLKSKELVVFNPIEGGTERVPAQEIVDTLLDNLFTEGGHAVSFELAVCPPEGSPGNDLVEANLQELSVLSLDPRRASP